MNVSFINYYWNKSNKIIITGYQSSTPRPLIDIDDLSNDESPLPRYLDNVKNKWVSTTLNNS